MPSSYWDPGSLTESPNPATAEIDRLSTLELVRRINAEAVSYTHLTLPTIYSV